MDNLGQMDIGTLGQMWTFWVIQQVIRMWTKKYPQINQNVKKHQGTLNLSAKSISIKSPTKEMRTFCHNQFSHVCCTHPEICLTFIVLNILLIKISLVESVICPNFTFFQALNKSFWPSFSTFTITK